MSTVSNNLKDISNAKTAQRKMWPLAAIVLYAVQRDIDLLAALGSQEFRETGIDHCRGTTFDQPLIEVKQPSQYDKLLQPLLLCQNPQYHFSILTKPIQPNENLSACGDGEKCLLKCTMNSETLTGYQTQEHYGL